MTSFDLSYDYRCPFAKIIHLHVITALKAGADFEVNFMPWTMSQGYKAEGAPDVWDDPEHDSDLLSLAVSTSIRDQQPEFFLVAHEAMFRARHERAIRMVNWEEIKQVLEPLGADLEKIESDVQSRRPHQVIGETFTKFSKYEAFGVPTFVVNGDATFVRYMKPPTGDAKDSIRVIESIVNLIELEPELNEFKHTKLPL